MEKKKPVKYEVLTAGKWEPVKRAEVVSKGFLHWEDYDHCVGLSRPGKWRERSQKEEK